MNDGGGNGTNCCGIEVRADTAKLTYMTILGFSDEICSENVRCSSKIKPRLRAEWVVLSCVF